MKIAFLTTYNWEGAYVLKTVLESGIPVDLLIVQDIWWKKVVFWGYSIKYWFRLFLDKTFGVYGSRYYTIPDICRRNKLKQVSIKDINGELDYLRGVSPDLIIVVGSRIIKKHIIEAFPRRIINFHTGILPQYRGPYSEFWAMYNQDTRNVGTTIHLIDTGIDTGDIIGQKRLTNVCDTPESAHIENVKSGAVLLVECLRNIGNKSLSTTAQDNSVTHYYSYPSDKEFLSLTKKIGKKFSIDFSE